MACSKRWRANPISIFRTPIRPRTGSTPSVACSTSQKHFEPSATQTNRRRIEVSTTHDGDSLETRTADEVVDAILSEAPRKRACFTCSFQAEDVIVLHLLRNRLPDIPVLFLETGYHFAETYEFRDRIAREWNLNLVNVAPERSVQQQEAELGILYREEPTRCCQLRKVE